MALSSALPISAAGKPGLAGGANAFFNTVRLAANVNSHQWPFETEEDNRSGAVATLGKVEGIRNLQQRRYEGADVNGRSMEFGAQ